MIIIEVMITAWTFGIPIVDVVSVAIDFIRNMKIADPFSRGRVG